MFYATFNEMNDSNVKNVNWQMVIYTLFRCVQFYALGLISRSVIAGEKSAAFKSNHLKARHDHCEMRHRQTLFHFSHQLRSQSYAIYCLPLVIEHEVTFSKRTFPQVNNK